MVITVVITLYLVILSIYDWKDKAVPSFLLLAGGVSILGYKVYQVAFMELVWQMLLTESLPAMMPGLILLFMAWTTGKAGFADGTVMLLMGILVGYRQCMFLFCISLVLISCFSGGVLLFQRGHKDTRIPYLPFMTISYLLGLC